MFILTTTLLIAPNVLDFEYFKFTFKRTGIELFTAKGLAQDVWSVLPQFIIDYWYLFILAFLLIYLSGYLYEKCPKRPEKNPKLLPYLFLVITSLGILLIASRGGLQLRPLSVLDASRYADAKSIPVVLNTPFTLIKSSYKEGIEVPNYLNEAIAKKLYQPIQHFDLDSNKSKPNVVLIIVESLGQEYMGSYSGKTSYTPFLDSLLKESLWFKHSFANAKKSIEALPAVLAGLPALMNTPYISSKYAGNKLSALPQTLKENGYSTHFFHGGANGTMGFNGFATMAGVEHYYGLDEYPNEEDYDGNWGIYDEPYLSYFKNELDTKKEPFFAGMFTLSSHHPFKVPEEHLDELKEGPLPIHRTIRYADLALRKFFNQAKTSNWFNNTLFVITADHTSQIEHAKYGTQMGIYKVPLMFYSPQLIQAKASKKLVQQADIFPSIIDFVGIEQSILSYGYSVFEEHPNRFAINFINGIYQYAQGDYCLHFNGEESIALYNFKKDVFMAKNILDSEAAQVKVMQMQLKAIIQDYNDRMVNNQLRNE